MRGRDTPACTCMRSSGLYAAVQPLQPTVSPSLSIACSYAAGRVPSWRLDGCGGDLMQTAQQWLLPTGPCEAVGEGQAKSGFARRS